MWHEISDWTFTEILLILERRKLKPKQIIFKYKNPSRLLWKEKVRNCTQESDLCTYWFCCNQYDHRYTELPFFFFLVLVICNRRHWKRRLQGPFWSWESVFLFYGVSLSTLFLVNNTHQLRNLYCMSQTCSIVGRIKCSLSPPRKHPDKLIFIRLPALEFLLCDKYLPLSGLRILTLFITTELTSFLWKIFTYTIFSGF